MECLPQQLSGQHLGIDDGRLDAALEAGRVGITIEERKAAYDDVQRRLTELVPGVWFIQSPPATITGADTHASGSTAWVLHSPMVCGSRSDPMSPRRPVELDLRDHRPVIRSR